MSDLCINYFFLKNDWYLISSQDFAIAKKLLPNIAPVAMACCTLAAQAEFTAQTGIPELHPIHIG